MFGNRYNKIWDDAASIPERRRIELIVAWKIIHELSHLGFTWSLPNGRFSPDGSLIISPEQFGHESGEFLEQKMTDGTAGFLFNGTTNKWNGSQEIVSLCITKPSWGAQLRPVLVRRHRGLHRESVRPVREAAAEFQFLAA